MTITARADFTKSLAAHPRLWAWVDLRVVALRVGDNYVNLATYGLLTAKALQRTRRVKLLARNDVVLAAHVVLPRANLNDVLEAIEAGKLEIGDSLVQYESTHSSSPPRACAFSTFRVNRIDRSYSSPALPWSGYVLETYGGNANALVHRIAGEWRSMDAALRNLPWPADDLGDLTGRVTGLEGWINTSTLVGVRFFAPLEARFDLNVTALASGEANFRIVAGSTAALRTATVNVFRSDDQAKYGGVASTAKERFTPPDSSDAGAGLRSIERRRKVPGARAVQFELRIGGEPVEVVKRVDYLAAGESVRVAAYRIFDPDLKVLRRRLRPGAKDRTFFEVTVGRVLMIAGFHVDVIRDPGLTDGVDIIAHDPWEKRMVAVECTTGALNAAGKMDKFMLRLAEFRRALPDVEIIGAIATGKETQDHAPDALDAAAKNRMAVIDPADLEALLELGLRGGTLSEAVGRIKQCVLSRNTMGTR